MESGFEEWTAPASWLVDKGEAYSIYPKALPRTNWGDSDPLGLS